MRGTRWLAAFATAAALVAVVATPAADAKPDLIVKKFLLGRLEPNTNRFVATGARGTTNAFRDDVVMLVFSGPVDFDTLDARTVRIGMPSQNGLLFEAEGDFYRYTTSRFEAVSGTWVPTRTWRNRVLFDPTSSQNPVDKNPEGFDANADFTVTVPGLDEGATKTVRARDGRRVARTFRTSFRTTARYHGY